jgi:hypothetical protein
MEVWTQILKYNPIEALKKIDDSLLQFHVEKYLLERDIGPPIQLWEHRKAQKILKNQLESGAWPDKRKKAHKNIPTNYQLLETYRYLGQLIEFFKFDKTHPAMEKAAEFVFKSQTDEGDFRGIYGNQYSPNYSSAILELLCKLGFVEDKRILRSFEWLLSIEQDDGGWIIPMQMPHVKKKAIELYHEEPLSPDKSLPFSHWVTGIVLRAFAQLPEYCEDPSALRAAKLIKTRFFKKDKYSSRRNKEYWTKYSYPFWWSDLISVLDTLSIMTFPSKDKHIQHALDYFRRTQKKDGSWDPYILKGKSFPNLQWWVNYRICLIFKRFYEERF